MQSGIKPHAYTPLFFLIDVTFFLKLMLENVEEKLDFSETKTKD